MIFSSLQYLLFLPLVVLLYWSTRGSTRYWLLIIASYFFYMSWMPVYGILLFALTLFNFWLGGLLYKQIQLTKEKTPAAKEEVEDELAAVQAPGRYRGTPRTQQARALFTIGLVLNLGCLFYYKYTNFAIESICDVYNLAAGAINKLGPAILPSLAAGGATPLVSPIDAPVFNILLPLAISFFVFEFVHYLADIYNGAKPVKSFQHFMVFASFFPSQIAGPIKRYQDFVRQLVSPAKLDTALFFEGTGLFVQGLFKKVAIADPAGSLIYPYFNSMAPMSGADAWLAALGFVIQVYCDFSAYTDMGRGSAMLMGIRLPENFELPYLARDLAEFWRKWHMSLSFWLRDYVYIPLGGSRKDRFLNWRNLMVTMVACGLWHGVGWHYAIFGVLQGLGLIVNREWRLFLRKFKSLEALLTKEPVLWLNNAITMIFIVLTFVIFRAPDMAHAMNVLGSMINLSGLSFNFAGECKLYEPILKAGLLPIMGVYIAAWLITEFLKKYPEPFAILRDVKTGYAYPLKLAVWTSAVILTIAARPLEAVPFVYFQF